mgnify:CR=1 FL=1
MDDGDAPGRVAMRMGVDFRRPAVRGPSRMRDPDVTGRGRFRQDLDQIVELARRAAADQLAVELLEGWTWRALAVTGAIVLVKEDGAVVCAAVVLADLAGGRNARVVEGRHRAGLCATVIHYRGKRAIGEVARAVGLGAVKYMDLSQNPQSLVVFTSR